MCKHEIANHNLFNNDNHPHCCAAGQAYKRVTQPKLYSITTAGK